MRLLKKYINFDINKFIMSLLISGTLIATSCVKKEDVLGTNIKLASSGFNIEEFSISTESPDFTTDTLTISAKFNEEVTAILNIKSITSGASKKITITGTEISEKWRGGHNGLQFFNTGDSCVVEMSVYGSDEVMTKSLVINTGFDFKTDDVYDAFPNGFEFASITSGQGAWWFNSVVSTVNDQSISPIQGNKYLKLEGNSPSSGVYVGGCSYGAWTRKPIRLISGDTVSVTSDEVWFNVYAYGTGDTETELYFTMFEDEGKDFNAKNTDDGVQVKLTFEHIGWKLFSYRYADIPLKTFNATTGNNIREPHRMVLWDIGLQTKTAGNYAKAIVDFPIITTGGPFDPSKF